MEELSSSPPPTQKITRSELLKRVQRLREMGDTDADIARYIEKSPRFAERIAQLRKMGDADADIFRQFGLQVGPASQVSEASAELPAPQQNDTPVKTPSFLEKAGHQLGLAGRAMASSVGGSLGLIGDPLNVTVNALTGSHLPPVSPAIQAGINRLFPQPQNATERVVNDASAMLAGMGSGSGLARRLSALLQPAARTATQGVLSQLGQLTKTNLASTAAGGLAASAAGEAGAPPLVQAALGLAPNLLLPKALTSKAASNPHVQTLLKEGVTPTPGQILGGLPRKMEDKATAIPFGGDFIERARERANDAFNRAAYGRALAPISQKPHSAVGREGVNHVATTLSHAYDAILPDLTFKADTQLLRDLSRIEQAARATLPDAEAKRFQDIVERHVRNKLTTGNAVTGQAFKGAESELTHQASGYYGDPSFDKRQLGAALDEVNVAIRDALQRSNPKFAKQLADRNRGYAHYIRVREAAASPGAKAGIIQPAHLAEAVRASDRSAGHGAYARGKALMQDLSDAAVTVLGHETAPVTSTAQKALGMMGLAGAAKLGYLPSSVLFGLAGVSGLYTPPVMKGLAALFTKRPAWAQDAAHSLRNAAPLTSWAIAPNVYSRPQ